jgi:NAD(P)-dependent dehydrogenase (short-subunit alcohol dehydrogenase family)
MVAYKDIQASNAQLNDANTPRVAVFVGGTSGIGKLTLHALVATGANLRIYLVGRPSSEERSRTFIQELQTSNPNAQVIWIEAEVSLLAQGKTACDIIKSKESHIDLIFLTAGYSPFGVRQETSEGREISLVLAYYTRALFVSSLLPLLEKAESPRVVSVLGGGMERTSSINVDDIDLKKPGSFGITTAQPHYLALNTVFLDKLASEHPDVTFVYSWPGMVNTGNVWRGLDKSQTILYWLIWGLLNPLIHLISSTDEEAGQRHLFLCTSAAFGGRGVPWQGKAGTSTLGKRDEGLFLANYKCESTPNAKVIPVLREKATAKVWEHTREVLRPYM